MVQVHKNTVLPTVAPRHVGFNDFTAWTVDGLLIVTDALMLLG